jgi:hypothetical protein
MWANEPEYLILSYGLKEMNAIISAHSADINIWAHITACPMKSDGPIQPSP